MRHAQFVRDLVRAAEILPVEADGPGGPAAARVIVAPPGADEAAAAATAFMRQVAGMPRPDATDVRWTDPDTCDVVIQPWLADGGGMAHGPATLVTVSRTQGAWRVLGARTWMIQVLEPIPLQEVASPVRVSGRALAFEGAVCVKVTEDRAGEHIVLGTGMVRGGGDTLRGFRGEVRFGRPSGPDGCLLLYETSEAIRDGTLDLAMVRVRFGETAVDSGRARG